MNPLIHPTQVVLATVPSCKILLLNIGAGGEGGEGGGDGDGEGGGVAGTNSL